MPIGFGNPWMLLGLGAVAVPILIHLLNRLRQRRVRWAAMALLRRALVLRSRRLRLEDLLLLALRCLAVVLLVLAMARPSLRLRAARYLGAGQRVGVVLALDVSMSMGYETGAGRRLDRARDLVGRLAETLEPGDPVTVVLLGRVPRVLERCRAFDPDRLAALLAKVEPLAEPLQIGPCLERVCALVEELREPVREVYVVTDGQAVTWADLPADARRALERAGRAARVFVVPVAEDTGENLALVRLEMVSGAPRTGRLARFAATVANFGDRPRRGVPVRLEVEGRVADQVIVDEIGPGRSAVVPLFVRFPPGRGRGPAGARSVRLVAAVAGDALPTDDLRRAAVVVRDRVRVLLVDGDPAPAGWTPAGPRLAGETAYLRAALAPRPTGRAAARDLEVSVVPWTAWPSLDLTPGRWDVIVLANVPDLPAAQADLPVVETATEPGGTGTPAHPSSGAGTDRTPAPAPPAGGPAAAASGGSAPARPAGGSAAAASGGEGTFSVAALRAWVQAGGGLLVFLGDRVNPVLAEARLGRGGAGLLPARLGRPVDVGGGEGGPLVLAERAHPLTAALAALPEGLIARSRVRRFLRVEPLEGSRTLLTVAGTDPPAPLLVARRVGLGRVLLCTTSADRAWGDLPLHPVWPILLHEAVRWLTSRGPEGSLVVGQPLVVRLSPHDLRREVVVRGPGGKRTFVRVTAVEGRPAVRFDATDRPGFYLVGAEDEGAPPPPTSPAAPPRPAGDGPVLVAVDPDPRESDVRALGPARLRAALAGLPVTVLEPGENLATAVREGRLGRPLWPALLAMALAALAVEGLLARRFARSSAGDEATAERPGPPASALRPGAA